MNVTCVTPGCVNEGLSFEAPSFQVPAGWEAEPVYATPPQYCGYCGELMEEVEES